MFCFLAFVWIQIVCCSCASSWALLLVHLLLSIFFDVSEEKKNGTIENCTQGSFEQPNDNINNTTIISTTNYEDRILFMKDVPRCACVRRGKNEWHMWANETEKSSGGYYDLVKRFWMTFIVPTRLKNFLIFCSKSSDENEKESKSNKKMM